MNIAKQIQFFKQQLALAQDTKLIAEQQIIIATRLETQAKSALEELGDSSGRAAKAKKYEISPELALKYKAQITKGKKVNA